MPPPDALFAPPLAAAPALHEEVAQVLREIAALNFRFSPSFEEHTEEETSPGRVRGPPPEGSA